jgi:1,4-alpha-glucan branching enzyme
MSAAMDPGVRDDGHAMVTFRLPFEVAAERVCVVGEFNDWSRDAHPMEPDGDHFVARIALPIGRTYRFRYLLDGERWENDWSADGYQPNEFGGDDSIIDLTGSALEGLPNTAMQAQVEPEPPPEVQAKPKRTRKKPATTDAP